MRLLKRLKLDAKGLHPESRLWSVLAGDLTAAGSQLKQLRKALQTTESWEPIAEDSFRISGSPSSWRYESKDRRWCTAQS